MSRLALLLLGVAGALVGLAGEAVVFGWTTLAVGYRT
jgi:hypothetical protein